MVGEGGGARHDVILHVRMHPFAYLDAQREYGTRSNETLRINPRGRSRLVLMAYIPNSERVDTIDTISTCSRGLKEAGVGKRCADDDLFHLHVSEGWRCFVFRPVEYGDLGRQLS